MYYYCLPAEVVKTLSIFFMSEATIDSATVASDTLFSCVIPTITALPGGQPISGQMAIPRSLLR
jgi:hypothetical protein